MLSNLIDWIKLPFREEKELYSALYKILGFYPHNITFYKVALMHKSVGHRATEKELKELAVADDKSLRGGKGKGKKGNAGKKGAKPGRPLNNERLEFLGDAILDAVVGAVAYKHFPGRSEGFLTNARSKMVQRESLGKLAQQMGLLKLVVSSARNATHNNYLGGNAFEALVGAIYLDRGYEACRQFWTKRVMGKYLDIDRVAYTEVNFKSRILEWSQKNRVRVDFRLEDQSKDNNGSPIFVYTTVIEGIEGCRAEGFSKKESQQRASEQTLKKLRFDKEFLDRVFAAKSARTQMEEMPVSVAPDVDLPENFVVIIDGTVEQNVPEKTPDDDEMSLDDITMSADDDKDREDIIAKAETEAYRNNQIRPL